MRQPISKASALIALAVLALGTAAAAAREEVGKGGIVHPARTSPDCSPGPFFTFFNRQSATVTPEAALVLDLVAQEYLADCPGARVMVAGHVDRALSDPQSAALSENMARSVAAGLIERGIPARLVRSAGYGEGRPRIPTPDGVWEVQNRRVEITFAR